MYLLIIKMNIFVYFVNENTYFTIFYCIQIIFLIITKIPTSIIKTIVPT